MNITTKRKSGVKQAVSAADANRRFSELLRTVRSGQSVVVTSHGKPVAEIVPAASEDPGMSRARAVLLARLSKETVTKAGRWTRDELYDDRP